MSRFLTVPSGSRARDLEEEAERHAAAIAGRASLEEDSEWVDASFRQRGSGEDEEGAAILHSEAGLLGLVREEHVVGGASSGEQAEVPSAADDGEPDRAGEDGDGDDDDDYADLTEFVGDNLAHDPVRCPPLPFRIPSQYVVDR